jgi:Molecular chaperone GrpE (heat shock protein)
MPQGVGSNDQTHVNDRAAAEAARQESAATAASPGELEAKLAELEAQIAQLKEERLRALAEVENVRRRAARDRQDASQYAISNFARDMLSVADNLQRALGSADTAARATDPALDALLSGVEMTERELLTVLERYGVKAIDAGGAPFDPHVHEAMFEIPNEAVPHGTVLQVLQQGYLLHDRTLRPARVGISRGGPKVAPGAAQTEGGEAAPRAEPAAMDETPRATTDQARMETKPDAAIDETVVDFTRRSTADPYPRQPDDPQRSGVRLDEKL